jgi:hypothetical protein
MIETIERYWDVFTSILALIVCIAIEEWHRGRDPWHDGTGFEMPDDGDDDRDWELLHPVN